MAVTVMFILMLWAFAFAHPINAIPTRPATSIKKRCSNILQNHSFESGLYPWLDIVFGPWAERGVFTSAQGGHNSRQFYLIHSNATVSHGTVALSQSGLSIPSGTTVDCSAWIASNHPGGSDNTSVELFIDEVSCGAPVSLSTHPWIKVNGKATVSQDSHTFSIVVTSEVTGSDGSTTWVDDAFVGMGC
ncbi:hypothetical protein HBI25_099080 [Parastagonospora nodorum]|nr:hypothetical protein HBI10_139210 [Parastagonospora nodorum]KAH4020297.1 hypothetical protein HBI13_113210 [Parastagonospora nodorum]KAH4048172.1 hypothetical protein HBH49_165200 [Parastagonospora nodorum]KAH4190883.1 hypothetical protein HBI95_217160 [Parastagonospora nodorum]KAH4260013.1 hypothetical protein HBI03_132980 [Parastagonospora nodorum]